MNGLTAIANPSACEPPVPESEEKSSPWRSAWPWLAGLVLVTIAVRLTLAFEETDIWWQMLYGKWMLQHHTLIPDHTAFTWTPTDGSYIYCAWIAEILFYLIHRAGGLVALYALPYLAALFLAALIWQSAWRAGMYTRPLTWLICLVAILLAPCGLMVKPEMFSYIFMILVVWLYWRLRARGVSCSGQAYWFPVLMLLWANSHGGFLCGVAFLALVGAGEALNILFSPSEAMPPPLRRPFLLSLLLSAIAVYGTPYGHAYLVQLFHETFLGGYDMQDYGTVRAYASILDPEVRWYNFPQHLCVAAILLLLLLWPQLARGRADWALILTNVFFVWLYTRFVRTTFFFAPVWAFAVLHLLATQPPTAPPVAGRESAARWSRALVGLLCCVLCGQAIQSTITAWYGGRWFGFGVSCLHPVEEAVFLRRHFSGRRLGCDYNIGGYLLWVLWPETKVSIDPRYFPFKAWYKNYLNFSAGIEAEEFTKRFPCDAWCLSHEFKGAISWFLVSPDWRLVHYGPTAVIFARKDLSLPPSLPLRSAAIGKIRNLNHAQKVLNMALRINDLAAAWCVVSGMEQNFRWPAQRRLVTSIRRYVDGVAFLYGGDCARAVSNLQSCAELKQFPSRGRLFDAYLKLAESSWRKGDARTAREASAAALALQPNDALALFNAGVIAWSTGRLSADKPARGDGCLSAPDGSGRTEADALMRRFLTRAMQGAIVRPESIRIAEAILAGACTNRPPLLAPSLPPLLKSRASPTEASADPGGSRR